MKDYKVYLFDFDGCLSDTIESLEYVFIQSFLDYGLTVKKEEVRQFTRQPLPVSYTLKGGDMKLYDEFYKNLCTYLNSKETVYKSKQFPETKKVINKLKQKGKLLGIVTSNNVPHVKEVLDLFKYDHSLFDVYIGNQESPICKPNPDPVLAAIKMLNLDIKKSDIVYIGDALDDVNAGKAAGVDYILLDRYNEYIDYKEKKISTLEELINE